MSRDPTAWGESLVDSHPDPKIWPKLDSSHKADIYRFATLWLTEGIPFSFQKKPIAFQVMRERLASRLGENSKSISMTGSARVGYSLNPVSFGRSYIHNSSDFDLFLISERWFKFLSDDFVKFSEAFLSNPSIAITAAEKRFFPANIAETPNTIRRGFIDQWRIPNRESYANVRRLYLAADGARHDLNTLMGGTFTTKVSIRVYKTWENAVSQIGGSLMRTVTSLP